MRALVPIVLALLMTAGCIEALNPGATVGGLPVSACDKGGPCNVLVSSGAGRATEPSVAVNPEDPLHVVAGIHATDTPTGDVWAAVHVSRDGGASWKHSFLPGYPGDSTVSPLTGYTVTGDPAVAFGPGGVVYYAGIAFHRQLWNVALFVARSDDGGESWPSISFVQRGVSSVVFNDKEYIAVDMESGDVYVTWTLFRFLPTTMLGVPVDPVGRGEIMFSRSTDQGATWSTPLRLSRTPWNQGSIPAVAPGGVLHVVWLEWTEEATLLMHARSADGGLTFTDPAVISEVTQVPSPLPNTLFRVNSMPTFAIDSSNGPTRGHLYVAWADARDEHADVLVSRSVDGGASWSPPRRVNDDLTLTDQFMPWMAVDERGAVHVLYLDRSEDPENVAYHARLATLQPGDVAFRSQRLSDAASDDRVGRATDALGREQPTFIGDYSALAVGGGRIYPLWPDLRNSKDGERHVDVLTTVLVG